LLSLFPLTVIIPAFNEQEGIGKTIAEIKRCLNCDNIIVVDGRSDDATVEIAEEMGAHVLFQDGIGKGNAVQEAIKHLNPKTKYVALIDADFTYPASYLNSMIKTLDDPSTGMVLGNRFSELYKTESVRDHYYLGNKIISFVHRFSNGINLQDPLTGLRIIKFELLKDWTPAAQGFDIEVELNCHTSSMGYKIVEVPIHYRKRLGKKKLGFINGIEIINRIFANAILPKVPEKNNSNHCQ